MTSIRTLLKNLINVNNCVINSFELTRNSSDQICLDLIHFCYAARDGVIYYADDGHLSQRGVELFGFNVLEAIKPHIDK